MTFFKDLTAYSYHDSAVRDNTLNVGWLDASQPFTEGSVPLEFMDKVWQHCRLPLVRMRGFYICEFCKTRQSGPLKVKRGEETLKLGTAEIRVFSPDGKIYASPDLIYHYITEHNYQPPDDFVAAVLSGPVPGTQEYATILNALGMR